jgi:hypothetical protein
MPNRLLREGICTSDTLDVLTPEEEVLFYRLLVVSDDYGLMDGRVAIIKAQCFPLKDRATTERIQMWVDGLAQKGLIRRYRVDGRLFVAIQRWENRIRSKAKYPQPEGSAEWVDSVCQQSADNCQQSAADGGLGRGKGKGRGASSRTSREMRAYPPDFSPGESTTEYLVREYSLTPEDVARYVDAFRDRCLAKGYRYVDWDAAFRNCVKDDWPKYRTSGIVKSRQMSIV